MDLPAGPLPAARSPRTTPVGGAVGSVIYDLEVPDFYKAPFSMSGLALTSLGGRDRVDGHGRTSSCKTVLPAPPVAQRTFPQNDEIALFAEVYDNQAATPHKVDIMTTVTTDEGTVLFKTEEERDSQRACRDAGAAMATRRGSR